MDNNSDDSDLRFLEFVGGGCALSQLKFSESGLLEYANDATVENFDVAQSSESIGPFLIARLQQCEASIKGRDCVRKSMCMTVFPRARNFLEPLFVPSVPFFFFL